MKEYVCPWCSEFFIPKEKRSKYCSRECSLEATNKTRKAQWALRLHDGMRLLSDDFGERNDDDTVTYQK